MQRNNNPAPDAMRLTQIFGIGNVPMETTQDLTKGVLTSDQWETLRQISWVDQSATEAAYIQMMRAGTSVLSFDGGGIVSGPDTGYPVNATFHGIEAIIPLGSGKKIQVEITGGNEEETNKLLTMLVNTVGDLNAKLRRIENTIDRTTGGKNSFNVEVAA